jgi:hypothetical protein
MKNSDKKKTAHFRIAVENEVSNVENYLRKINKDLIKNGLTRPVFYFFC